MYSSLVGSVEVEAQMPGGLFADGFPEIVRWVDEQALFLAFPGNTVDAGEPVETGAYHIHGDDNFFFNQLVEQLDELFPLDFTCIPHS